ncbi:hypothetical protein [Psychrobacter sp. FDAARGOS_221]|uniref:hypothetical protein n=1 Tax=Psychrobacter sp. FDAARGOS_221 TaxID=1975705 RepID=UPI000BB592D4|nr:hypothetical protein [Psychrobacter sp. FDAARGOS_221]PNK60533.1 hypothetical protein A6J60_006360 [Psychrobacter sp. FDAARGOS_221]
MTQVAFSHQFSQRWIDTPAEIKSALIQRLDDIVRLLDVETDLQDFQFSVPDLDAHLDELYSQLAAERQALAEEQALAEQQAAEEAQTLSDTADADHASMALADADSEQTFDVDIDELESSNNETAVETENGIESDIESDNSADVETDTEESNAGVVETEPAPATAVDTVDDNSVSTNPVSSSAPPAFAFEQSQGEVDAEFIKGLERSIDDYLSEQLSSMSEDLKAWLREAINSRLNEQSNK